MSTTAFFKRIIARYGEVGQAWVGGLPALLEDVTQAWDLADLRPAENLSMHYVLTGRRRTDQLPIVVKFSVGSAGTLFEANAISSYQGNGCVNLLAVDIDRGAMLLERIEPGYPLSRFFPTQEEDAIQIAANVIKKLHHHTPAPNQPIPLKGMAQELRELYAAQDGLPAELLAQARVVANNLQATTRQTVVLHGDLHHDNILYSQTRGWLAIDPKGLWGDPAYEIGSFLRNPFPAFSGYDRAKELTAQRLKLFSHLLGFDKKRLQQWGFVQAVLAACWAVQDKQDPEPWLTAAKIIQPEENCD